MEDNNQNNETNIEVLNNAFNLEQKGTIIDNTQLIAGNIETIEKDGVKHTRITDDAGNEFLSAIDYIEGECIRRIAQDIAISLDTYSRKYKPIFMCLLTENPNIISNEAKKALYDTYGFSTSDFHTRSGLVGIVPAYRLARNDKDSLYEHIIKFGNLHVVLLCFICPEESEIIDDDVIKFINSVNETGLNFLKDVFFKESVEKYPLLESYFKDIVSVINDMYKSAYMPLYIRLRPKNTNYLEMIKVDVLTSWYTSVIGALDIDLYKNELGDLTKLETAICSNKEIVKNILGPNSDVKKLVKLSPKLLSIKDSKHNLEITHFSLKGKALGLTKQTKLADCVKFVAPNYLAEFLYSLLIVNHHNNVFKLPFSSEFSFSPKSKANNYSQLAVKNLMHPNLNNIRREIDLVFSYNRPNIDYILKERSSNAILDKQLPLTIYINEPDILKSLRCLTNAYHDNENFLSFDYSGIYATGLLNQDIKDFIQTTLGKVSNPAFNDSNFQEDCKTICNLLQYDYNDPDIQAIKEYGNKCANELANKFGLDAKTVNHCLDYSIKLDDIPRILENGYIPIILSPEDMYNITGIRTDVAVKLPAFYNPFLGELHISSVVFLAMFKLFTNTDAPDKPCAIYNELETFKYGTRLLGLNFLELITQDFDNNETLKKLIMSIAKGSELKSVSFIINLIMHGVQLLDKIAQEHTLHAIKKLTENGNDDVDNDFLSELFCKTKSINRSGNYSNTIRDKKTYTLDFNRIRTVCKKYANKVLHKNSNETRIVESLQDNVYNKGDDIENTVLNIVNIDAKAPKNKTAIPPKETIVENEFQIETTSSNDPIEIEDLDLDEKTIATLVKNNVDASDKIAFLFENKFYFYFLSRFIKHFSKEKIIKARKQLLDSLNKLDNAIEDMSIITNESCNSEEYKKDKLGLMFSKAQRQIAMLKRNKKIKHVRVFPNNNIIIIDLQDHTYVVNPKTKVTHDLGPVSIVIPFSLTNNHVLKSIYTDDIRFYHTYDIPSRIGDCDSSADNDDITEYFKFPVIHGKNNGWFCAGDSGRGIKNAVEQGNLVLLVNILIQYAESVNIKDFWGIRIPACNIASDISEPYTSFVNNFIVNSISAEAALILNDEIASAESKFKTQVKLYQGSAVRSLYRKFLEIPEQFMCKAHLQELADKHINSVESSIFKYVPLKFNDTQDIYSNGMANTMLSIDIKDENVANYIKNNAKAFNITLSSSVKIVRCYSGKYAPLFNVPTKYYKLKDGKEAKLSIYNKNSEMFENEISYFGYNRFLMRFLQKWVSPEIAAEHYSFQIQIPSCNDGKIDVEMISKNMAMQFLGYTYESSMYDYPSDTYRLPSPFLYQNCTGYADEDDIYTSFTRDSNTDVRAHNSYFREYCSHPVFIKNVTPTLNAEIICVDKKPGYNTENINIIFYKKEDDGKGLTFKEIEAEKDEICKVMPFMSLIFNNEVTLYDTSASYNEEHVFD